MTNIICAIYDEKTLAYFGVHEAPTAGHAIRNFGDHSKNPNSPLHRHPGDYKLYKIGTLDVSSGEILHEKNPIYLSSALDFVQTQDQQQPVTTTRTQIDHKDRNLPPVHPQGVLTS